MSGQLGQYFLFIVWLAVGAFTVLAGILPLSFEPLATLITKTLTLMFLALGKTMREIYGQIIPFWSFPIHYVMAAIAVFVALGNLFTLIQGYVKHREEMSLKTTLLVNTGMTLSGIYFFWTFIH